MTKHLAKTCNRTKFWNMEISNSILSRITDHPVIHDHLGLSSKSHCNFQSYFHVEIINGKALLEINKSALLERSSKLSSYDLVSLLC